MFNIKIMSKEKNKNGNVSKADYDLLLKYTNFLSNHNDKTDKEVIKYIKKNHKLRRYISALITIIFILLIFIL